MLIQVVSYHEDLGFADQLIDSPDPLAAMEIRGFDFLEGRCGGQHLRAELRGQPMFKGLAGPMWGGVHKDGRPIVRYEDARACEILSR